MPETPEPETPEPETPEPETPEFEDSEPEDSAPAQPAPNRKLFVVFALLFLIAFAGVRWWYYTGQALDQVAVESSVPACTGTQIGDIEVDGNPVAAPDVVPGMRCEVIINVVNNGAKTVTVSRVIVPGLGSDSPLPVRAAEMDGRKPTVANSVDAAYKIDKELGAGEFLELSIAYEYDDSGCLESTTYTDLRWPTVEVTASNRSRGVHAGRTFALHGTDESIC